MHPSASALNTLPVMAEALLASQANASNCLSQLPGGRSQLLTGGVREQWDTPSQEHGASRGRDPLPSRL